MPTIDLKQLIALSEQKPDFERVELAPLRALDFAGRSLTVIGKILDGEVKLDPERKSKATGLIRIGKGITTVARILTPGSIQGAFYKHWMALAWILAIFLGIAAYFNGKTYLAPAEQVFGSLLLISALIWTTRLALTKAKLLVRLAGAAFALGFAAIIAYATLFFVQVPLHLHAAFYWLAGSPKGLQPVSLAMAQRYVGIAVAGGCGLVIAVAWSVMTEKPGKLSGKVKTFASIGKPILSSVFTFVTVLCFAASWGLWDHIVNDSSVDDYWHGWAQSAPTWAFAGLTCLLILVGANLLELIRSRRL